MRLYSYSLCRDPPSIGETKGIAEATPYVVECAQIYCVVSDFPSDAVLITKDNVFAHARVVRHVFEQTTPLPFRFGTMLGRARLEAFIASHQDSFRQQLALVAGCVEMSIKLIIGDGSESSPAADQGRASSDRAATMSGTEFLEDKQRRNDEEERLAEAADEVKQWLATSLEGLAKASRIDDRLGRKLLVTVAYLIEKPRLDAYEARVAEMRRERPNLRFLASGPWPPYSFAEVPSPG